MISAVLSMALVAWSAAAQSSSSATSRQQVEKHVQVTEHGNGQLERRVIVLRRSPDGTRLSERSEISTGSGASELSELSKVSAESSTSASGRKVESTLATSSASQVFVLASPEEAPATNFEVRTRVVEGNGSEAVNVFEWVHSTPAPAGGFLGVEVLPLTDALRDHFASPRGLGVLISDVQSGSPAGQVGLRAGDVVTRIAGHAVTSTHGFGRALRRFGAGEQVALEIWREGLSSRFEPVLDAREHHVLEFGNDGRMVRLEGPLDEELHFDVEGAAIEIREVLGSGAWKAKVEDLRAIDVEALERRVRQLEKELAQLRAERRRQRE